MSVLPALVEEARLRYMEIGRTYITVHMTSVRPIILTSAMLFTVPFERLATNLILVTRGLMSSRKSEDPLVP